MGAFRDVVLLWSRSLSVIKLYHAQSAKAIEYTFSGTTSYSSAKLVFMLGNVGSTSNTAHTVQIDDVHVYQLS